MPATLIDVARHAGVSLATASRVLNGSTRSVTPALRQRVLAAAAALAYVPNAHAQALARASTATIGVIVHDMSDPYFSEILRGVQQVASANERLVMVCNSYRDPDRELAYVTLLQSQRVEALVLAGSGLDDRRYTQRLAAQVEAFAAAGGRTVFIGRHNILGDAVVPNNSGGARALGRALIGLGHRRFGVIGGPPLLTTTRDRLDGFRQALAKAGIALPPTSIIPCDFTRDGGAAATAVLLAQAPDITAIFALNDSMAVGALAALRSRSVRVPEEISVAGFDDIPITRDVTPALSTVRVPMVELGARAVARALDPRASEPRIEHLPTEVLLRASTAVVG
jgi:LacI family transcriptional regulator, galactose operon repressor